MIFYWFSLLLNFYFLFNWRFLFLKAAFFSDFLCLLNSNLLCVFSCTQIHIFNLTLRNNCTIISNFIKTMGRAITPTFCYLFCFISIFIMFLNVQLVYIIQNSFPSYYLIYFNQLFVNFWSCCFNKLFFEITFNIWLFESLKPLIFKFFPFFFVQNIHINFK